MSVLERWSRKVREGLAAVLPPRDPAPPQKDRHEEAVIAVQTARNLQTMVQSPGWKLFEGVMEDRRKLLQAQLQKAELRQVQKLQAQLDELEFIQKFVADRIEEGEAAREFLEDKLDE
jgi:hypothetical protein